MTGRGAADAARHMAVSILRRALEPLPAVSVLHRQLQVQPLNHGRLKWHCGRHCRLMRLHVRVCLHPAHLLAPCLEGVLGGVWHSESTASARRESKDAVKFRTREEVSSSAGVLSSLAG